ncbi:MAG: hypothetical protein NTX17_01210 [Candidatus Eisenbacteria bacterium]|nr:hypothetical protein [Candidatus Eisenbacteria bacterium]
MLLTTAGGSLAATDPVPSTYYQNLVELFNRKSMSVSKPSALLVESNNWQSERVIFRDVTYGTEMWKLTNDPDFSRHNNGINKTPWNCDGSRIAFVSPRRAPGELYDGDPDWYIMNGDGSGFRRLLPYGVTNASYIPPYTRIAAWDRVNASFIYFGYFDGLYKVNLASGDLMTLEESFPETTRRKEIDTYLSENNRVMVIDRNQYIRDGSFYPNVYMVDLNKAKGAPGRLVSYNLHFNLTGITGHSVSNECCYHDDGTTFMRTADDSWQLTYEAPEGGEALMFEIPYSGNRDSITVMMSRPDPALPYYSHPAWGMNNEVVYYDSDGDNDYGLILRNNRTKTFLRQLVAMPYAGGGHTAWDGYDSTWVFTAPTIGYTWGGTIVKARTDMTYAAPIANTYSFINGGAGDYSANPRPAQSPDATKAFFTSSMLQTSDDRVDMYVAVSRHPYPPANVRALSLSQNQVTLAWNRPQVAREIKGFHVYRSVDSDNNFLEISPAVITDQEYVDNTVSAGHSYYYAVTSEENSGLESDYLSNVLMVTVSSGSATWNNYRAEGLTGWDTTHPGKANSLSVSQVSAGVYQLTWQGPTDKDVRYYNIYYSVAGAPACTPQRLIASPGAAATKFVDWQANSSYSPYYAVTAMDRAGNESLPTYFPSSGSDTTPPAPVGDLR